MASKEGLVYLNCLREGYTLQRACRRYIAEGGVIQPDTPECELHGTVDRDIVLPMRCFRNNIGHWLDYDSQPGGNLVCFTPTLHPTTRDMASALSARTSSLSV